MGDSFDLGTIRHFGDVLQVLEGDPNKQVRLTSEFRNGSRVYSVRAYDTNHPRPKGLDDELQNMSARRALYRSISETKGYSQKAVDLAGEILLREEDRAKPLDSRTLRKVQVALSAPDGTAGKILESIHGFAKDMATRFANDFTSDKVGTLHPKLESLYLAAFNEEVSRLGKDAMKNLAPEDIDRLLWAAENRVYAENEKLFDALDKAKQFADRWVGFLSAPKGGGEEIPALKKVRELANSADVPEEAREELEKLLRLSFKESIVQQLLDVRDGKVPFEDVLGENALAAVGKMCELYQEELPALLKAITDEYNIKDEELARALVGKEFARRVFKAGEAEAGGLAKLDLKALINGGNGKPGLCEEMKAIVGEYLAAMEDASTEIRTMFDDIPKKESLPDVDKNCQDAVKRAQGIVREAFKKEPCTKSGDIVAAAKRQLREDYKLYFADLDAFAKLKESVPEIVTKLWGPEDKVPLPEEIRTKFENKAQAVILERFKSRGGEFHAEKAEEVVVKALKEAYRIDLYKAVMAKKEAILLDMMRTAGYDWELEMGVRARFEGIASRILLADASNAPKTEEDFLRAVWNDEEVKALASKPNKAEGRPTPAQELKDSLAELEKKIAYIEEKRGKDTGFRDRMKRNLERILGEGEVSPERKLFAIRYQSGACLTIEEEHFTWTVAGVAPDFADSATVQLEKGEKALRSKYTTARNKSKDALKRLSMSGAPYSVRSTPPIVAIERDFLNLYRKGVKTALAGAKGKELDEWLRKVKTAADGLKPDTATGYTDPAAIDAYAKVADGFSEFVRNLTEPIARQAYETVISTLSKTDRRILPLFADAGSLAIDKARDAIQTYGYTLGEVADLSDEMLGLFARYRKANVLPTKSSLASLITQGKAGLIPPELMTEKALSLVTKLLSARKWRVPGLPSKIDTIGMGTGDARKILFALKDNGFLQLVEGMDDSRIETAAKAILILYAINNGSDGLDDLCQRLFGTTIDKVTNQQIAVLAAKIETNVKTKAPTIFAGIDPIRGLKGSAADIHALLSGESSLQDLNLAKDPKATKGLLDLRAGLERLRTAQVKGAQGPATEKVTVGDATVELSKDGQGKVCFKVAGFKCTIRQDLATLIDGLTLAFVSDIKTFGAEAVRSLLPARKLADPAAFDVAARDICTALLRAASGLQAVRFVRLGVVQLNELAHKVLDAMSRKDADIGKMVAEELAKAKNVGLNTEETIEQFARAERAGEKAVGEKVVIGAGSAITPVPPMRNFAAELFLRQQTWKDDGVARTGDRLQAIFRENVQLLKDLMSDPSRYDEMKTALDGKGEAGLGASLKTAVESIRKLAGAKAGEVPSEQAIRKALASAGANEVFNQLSADLDRAGTGLLNAAQKMFTDRFVAAIKSSSTKDADLELKTLHQLAGFGALDLTQGFGKFLGEAFKSYFGSATGADRDAILRSLVVGTKPGADPVEIMAALVKGAGPVFQKLIQGIPLNAIDESVRPVIEASKSSLDPIPRDIVKTKLFDMVERSHGRIQSIEVKKSLGAASVGEALLCVIRTKENPYGEECVIKLLRPDVQTRAQREYRFLSGIADGIPGVKRAFAGRYAGIEEEMDLTIEARNVGLGRIYSPGGRGTGADGIDSMTLNPLVSPSSGAIVLNKAPGVTVDRLIATTKGRIDDIARHFRRQVKDGDRTVTVMASRPVSETLTAKKELMALYASLLARHQKLIKFSRMWTEEAIFTSGIFHGDLHAGNIMVDDDQLTVIDYGNVSKLESTARDRLMRIIAGCSLGAAVPTVTAIRGLMSPEGAREFTEDKKKALTADIEKIFKKGTNTDAPLRLSAVIRLLERNGLEVPVALFNFAQSLSRLQTTIDSVEDVLSRIKALSNDISFDDSDYGEEIAGKNWGSQPIKVRISKSNPLDFMGAFAAYAKGIPKRTVQQVQEGTYPLSREQWGKDAEAEIVKDKYEGKITKEFFPSMDAGEDNKLVAKLHETIFELTSSPANFEKLKTYLAECVQMNGSRLRGVEGGRVGAQQIDSLLEQFASGKDPWSDEAARHKLAEAIIHEYGLNSISSMDAADCLYPEFAPHQSYGEVLGGLVESHKGDVWAKAGIKLLAAATFYSSGRLEVEDAVSEADENANDEVEAWLEEHPGFFHYDAEQLKTIGKTLLRFNDGTFLPCSILFVTSPWSANPGRRKNFLTGMKANLEAMDVHLAQLGAKDDYTKKLQRECLMTYYRARTDVKNAFSTTGGMSKEHYETLVREAEQMSGKDSPLVKCIRSFREFALKNERKDAKAEEKKK